MPGPKKKKRVILSNTLHHHVDDIIGIGNDGPNKHYRKGGQQPKTGDERKILSLIQNDQTKKQLEFVKNITDIDTLIFSLVEFKYHYYSKGKEAEPIAIHKQIVQTLLDKLTNEMIGALASQRVATLSALITYFFNKGLIQSTENNQQLFLKLGDAVEENSKAEKWVSEGVAAYVIALGQLCNHKFFDSTCIGQIRKLAIAFSDRMEIYFNNFINEDNTKYYCKYLRGLSFLYSQVPGIPLPKENFFVILSTKINSLPIKMAVISLIRGIIASPLFSKLEQNVKNKICEDVKKIVTLDIAIASEKISSDQIKNYLANLGFLVNRLPGNIRLSDSEFGNINELLLQYKLSNFACRALVAICNALSQLHRLDQRVLLSEAAGKHLRDLVMQTADASSGTNLLLLVTAWSRVEKSNLCPNNISLPLSIKKKCIDTVINSEGLKSKDIAYFLEVSSFTLKEVELNIAKQKKLAAKLQKMMKENAKNPEAVSFILASLKDLLISKLLNKNHLNYAFFRDGLNNVVKNTNFEEYCQYMLRSLGYLQCQGMFGNEQLDPVIDSFCDMVVDSGKVNQRQCLEIISGFCQFHTNYFTEVLKNSRVRNKLVEFISATKLDGLSAINLATLLDNLAKYQGMSNKWKLKPKMLELVGALENKLNDADISLYKLTLCAKLFSALEKLDYSKDAKLFKRLLTLTTETTLKFFSVDLETSIATDYGKADPHADCQQLRKLCAQGEKNRPQIIALCLRHRQRLRSWTDTAQVQQVIKPEKTPAIEKQLAGHSRDNSGIYTNLFADSKLNQNISTKPTVKKRKKNTTKQYETKKKEFHDQLKESYPELELTDSDRNFINKSFKDHAQCKQPNYEQLSVALMKCVTWQGPPFLSSIFNCCGHYEFDRSQFTAPTLEALQPNTNL